jgi:amino-acid N-acetyltransferase
MITEAIHPRPSVNAALAILEAAALPVSDITEAHMEHFFYCGLAAEPTGLVGLELCGPDALLRSLVVASNSRSSGTGSALVAHAESHARALGVRAIFLLTTTAEPFFKRLGYVSAAREDAPAAIRTTREFADICPASSAFLAKQL